ncbi:MAG: tRNA pseudouridine13 synthase [Bacteroidia bacterium]|jgi:tRNA pseudouridine13 synthase
MNTPLPRAFGAAAGQARIRLAPADFRVFEELGFEPSGDGEHACLLIEKTGLNTLDLQRMLAEMAGVPRRDVGFSGMKDRNAVTHQWFSVGLAGRDEPHWQQLEQDHPLQILRVDRHQRKLRRGVHRANRFELTLRELQGKREALEARLQTLREKGVPNYFGEQRFGRNNSTLEQALAWSKQGGKRKREQRSLMLSALRSHIFNQLLATRIEARSWDLVQAGDVCLLHGTRSFFHCETVDQDIQQRSACGDINAGLPLWGRSKNALVPHELPSELAPIGLFLESQGLELAWRAARVIPDDFYWQFCDDDVLQLNFRLPAGSYATAVLSEFVQYHANQGAS